MPISLDATYVEPFRYITTTFEGLMKKLREAPATLRLAVIDHWIGLLFLERAKIQSRPQPP